MLNERGLADELNDLMATETRSLVRHVSGAATPYVTARTYKVWKAFGRMSELSERHAAELSALIDRLDLPPRSIPYSTDVARFHFTSIESLLPPLIEEKHKQIAAYQRAIDHARSDPALLRELEDLLGENEAQLRELQEHQAMLAAPATAPPVP